MTLTPEGRNWIWGLARGHIDKLEISDGRAKARVKVDTVEVTAEGLKITAEFGSDMANFDWKISRVVNDKNEIVDEHLQDLGRKVAGGIWTATHIIAWRISS